VILNRWPGQAFVFVFLFFFVALFVFGMELSLAAGVLGYSRTMGREIQWVPWWGNFSKRHPQGCNETNTDILSARCRGLRQRSSAFRA
jgi:hypothetical protein